MGPAWFTYDKVNRLTAGNVYTDPLGGGAGTQQGYTFDPFENLTAITGANARNTPTAAATNRLTTGTYDAAGNLTNWNGAVYRYGFQPDGPRDLGSGELGYIYTADDERIWSYNLAANVSNWTVRDLSGQVLREYVNDNGAWTLGTDYIHRDGQLLAAETRLGRRHFHLDHLGTPRLITNSVGYKKAYHAYYPFGEEATAFNQDGERMKFTGHERDLGSTAGVGDDLDYMHARHCSPVTGRFFLSTDPVMGDQRRPQMWSRYTYGLDNPMKYVDPTGEVVNLSKLTEEQRKELIEKLNSFTGNKYSVNENMELVLSEVGAGASKTATDFLNEAISSDKNYSVVAHSGRNKYDKSTGNILLNFSSFEGVEYGKVDPRTFNIGSIFVRELHHTMRGSEDTVSGVILVDFSWTGPAVDFENQIRSERGLPRRAAYLGEPASGNRERVRFNYVNPKRPEKIFSVIPPRF